MSMKIAAGCAAILLVGCSPREAASDGDRAEVVPRVTSASSPGYDDARIEELRRQYDADPNLKAKTRAAGAMAAQPMPANKVALDRYLAEGQFEPLAMELSRGTTADEVERIMNWERAKVFEGGPLFLVVAYTRHLWLMSNNLPPPLREGLREGALSMALYGRALIEIDGLRCAEPDAASSRRKQHIAVHQGLWEYAAQATPATRERAKFAAVMTEYVTAPVRRNDTLLCQGETTGDLSEIAEGLAAQQGRPLEKAPVQDHFGTTYLVPRAPPKFLPEADWRPRQDEVRARLPSILSQQLGR